jgi:hypothetical protein
MQLATVAHEGRTTAAALFAKYADTLTVANELSVRDRQKRTVQ